MALASLAADLPLPFANARFHDREERADAGVRVVPHLELDEAVGGSARRRHQRVLRRLRTSDIDEDGFATNNQFIEE